MTKVFIIAEAGVNHNGDIDLAIELVDKAILSNADAVKFQAAIPELVATEKAEKANYQKKTMGGNTSQLDMLRNLLLPLKDFDRIAKYCNQKSIIFFATAFDLISLDYVNKLKQPYHKIPSGEITNLPYLRQVAKYGKPILLSTGMADMNEIQSAISVIESVGFSKKMLTVLQCNTEYPTPIIDVNLKAMKTIQEKFSVAIGYSDHTAGIEIPIAAVALGASVIEKHFTLDCNMTGPDHKASLEPEQFLDMVKGIRKVEQALGSNVKQATLSELKNKEVVRRSIVAALDIKTGDTFTSENIIAKRPGTGLSPMKWDFVIGRKATKDFKSGDLICL